MSGNSIDTLALFIAMVALIVPILLEFIKNSIMSRIEKEDKLDFEILEQRKIVVKYINELDQLVSYIDQDETEDLELKIKIERTSILRNEIFSLFPTFDYATSKADELVKSLKDRESNSILLNFISNTQDIIVGLPNDINRSVEKRELIVKLKEVISYILSDYIPKARTEVSGNAKFIKATFGVVLGNKNKNLFLDKRTVKNIERIWYSNELLPLSLRISEESVPEYYKRVATLFKDNQKFNLSELKSISARFNKEGSGKPSWKVENTVIIDGFGTFYTNISRSVAQDVVKQIYMDIK